MKRPCLSVLAAYWHNPIFRYLGIVTAASAVASRILIHFCVWIYANDFFSVLFVMTLWLLFQLGILLKIQTVHYAAGILPGYRRRQAAVFLFLYVSLIVMAVWWWQGQNLRLPWLTEITMKSAWLICLLVSLLVAAAGYFSHWRVLLYGYCALLLASGFSMPILDEIQRQGGMLALLAGAWGLGVAALLLRLLSVREESWEYGHVLSWPPLVPLITAHAHYRPRRLRGSGQRPPSVPKYPQDRPWFRRVGHWEQYAGRDPDLSGAMAWVILMVYALFGLKVDWMREWLLAVEENFLVFVFTPLVIMVVSQYQRLAFWGYDLVRPVGRRRYFHDQGILAARALLVYWFLTVIYFGYLPQLIVKDPGLDMGRLAGFFVLSGAVLVFLTAVLVRLAAQDSPLRTVVSGGIAAVIVSAFYKMAPDLTVTNYYFGTLACLISGLIIINQAYHAWCRKEFV